MAVCGFCRSTLVREGEALRRIGQSAELFDDFSPLQLGAAGRWQGQAFSLVGRLQMAYAGGVWNEWHALFDTGEHDQRSGWLSEDNGRYVMAFDAPAPADLPALESMQPGQGVAIDARLWQVAAVTLARVGAAQGELPQAPNLADQFTLVELRNAQDEVGTLDYSEPNKPRWSVGRSVALGDLQLSGLRQGEAEKTLSARGAPCPNCGAALQVTLASTQSIVCGQCQAVVDVSQGLGGDLAHYKQGAPQGGGEPLLALGSSGQLALGGPVRAWQVVGYVERCELPEDPEDARVYWHEYLLYAQEVGFSFLVDSEDGWSWATPITGAPVVSGDSARWRDHSYRKLYDYQGQITYVLGEFYWRLSRGQRTANTDYAVGSKRLNREKAGNEVTWSAGQTLESATVAKAFRLPPDRHAALQRDASPLSGGAKNLPVSKTLMVMLVVFFLLVMAVKACSRDGCDNIRNTFGLASNEYQQCLASDRTSGAARSRGGSFGGFSGGGHK